MEERRLGPVVGLGTWRTFGSDVERAERVVDAALDAGLRIFDTSPMYGGAEWSLARALGDRRDDVTVATKIWAGSVHEGRSQYADQLGWFGQIEIEQVHNLVAWREHLPWLEAERAEGRIERLGVTHYSPSAFDELAAALETGAFETAQVPVNPLERTSEQRVLPLAAERGVAVIVAQPLGVGSLVRRAPAERELAPLREFGIETWAQALLKWALSDERVDAVIPGTKDAAHARENARAGSPPWFEPDERRLVESLAGA